MVDPGLRLMAVFFLAGTCHDLAPVIEAGHSAGTRPGHRHPQNEVELAAALAKAALHEETKSV
ncbi:MAG TPA: hypothetical protein VK481_00400 [Gemmatimonadaceae bacterium]|nr:hypothetical protein [Gemmatimonadaceae bacterium]